MKSQLKCRRNMILTTTTKMMFKATETMQLRWNMIKKTTIKY